MSDRLAVNALCMQGHALHRSMEELQVRSGVGGRMNRR